MRKTFWKRKSRCFGTQNMDKMSWQHEETQVQEKLRNKEKEIVFSFLLICFFLSSVSFMKKKLEFPTYHVS